MKFSEFDESSWPALSPYLDTCLLPVTGLYGTESPDEMTDKVAAAGSMLSPVEQAFKGRTVTLPAYHYFDGGRESVDALNGQCSRYRRIGFRYVVLVCGIAGRLDGIQGADLILQPQGEEGLPDPETIRKRIVDMWRADETEPGELSVGGQANRE